MKRFVGFGNDAVNSPEAINQVMIRAIPANVFKHALRRDPKSGVLGSLERNDMAFGGVKDEACRKAPSAGDLSGLPVHSGPLPFRIANSAGGLDTETVGVDFVIVLTFDQPHLRVRFAARYCSSPTPNRWDVCQERGLDTGLGCAGSCSK
jgi:hypothetical protein